MDSVLARFFGYGGVGGITYSRSLDFSSLVRGLPPTEELLRKREETNPSKADLFGISKTRGLPFNQLVITLVLLSLMPIVSLLVDTMVVNTQSTPNNS